MYLLFNKSQFPKKYYITLIISLVAITILNVYAIGQEKAGTATAPGKVNQKPWETEVTGWQIKDYGPYIQAMKDISKMSQDYSENMLKLAIDEYSAGIDRLEKMEAEIYRLEQSNINKKNPGKKNRHEIELEDREKKQIYRIKQEAKMKSATYFFLSISHTDEIQSKSILESTELLNFRMRLYQVYAAVQYDLQNFSFCIPVLEKYITLNKDKEKNLWAHKYLANCYAFMEALSKKSKSITAEDSARYTSQKNKYLLKAAEIQYGIESPEYKNMQDIISKYEKRSIKDAPQNPVK
jgi:hypothetical protein